MGKLIAFEGLDKSGKKTQSIMLVDWLREKGHTAVRVEVPIYDTPIGKEIRASLYNERDYNPREFQFLMIMNRYELQPVLQRMLLEHDYVVLDRYDLSGIVYGSIDGVSEILIEHLQTNLIKPDMGFLLDVPVEVSMQRKRPDLPDDRYESDMLFLDQVRTKYREVCRIEGYRLIDGTMPVEKVHNTIKMCVV